MLNILHVRIRVFIRNTYTSNLITCSSFLDNLYSSFTIYAVLLRVNIKARVVSEITGHVSCARPALSATSRLPASRMRMWAFFFLDFKKWVVLQLLILCFSRWKFIWPNLLLKVLVFFLLCFLNTFWCSITDFFQKVSAKALLSASYVPFIIIQRYGRLTFHSFFHMQMICSFDTILSLNLNNEFIHN